MRHLKNFRQKKCFYKNILYLRPIINQKNQTNMKKVFLFVAVVSAFSFASCKKDRTCTCTTTSASGTVTETKTTMYKVKKGDATENCIGSQTVSTSGAVSITGSKTTCKLK